MTQSLFIKYEFGEAVNSKKDILNAEITMINIIKRISAYRTARKKELAKKAELKSKLTSITKYMGELKKILPKSDIPKIEVEEEALDSGKKQDLELELKLIQTQLAKLQ